MDIEKFPWGNKKFNPVSLFKNGEQGVWYDPSDISRYMGNLGPELVTNGDFSQGLTGWFDGSSAGGVITVIDGQLNLINTTGTARASQTIPFVSGKRYKLSFNTSASVTVYYNSTAAYGTFSAGYNETTFVANNTYQYFNPRNFGAGTTITLDNISIREMGTSSIGDELITNGDFSSDGTDWIDVSTSPAYIDYTGSGAVLVSNGNTSRIRKQLSTVVGKQYIVTVIHNTVNSVARFSIGYTGGSSELLSSSVINTGRTIYTFVAGTTTTWFNWFNSGAPNIEITSLSVKEINTFSNITMFQEATGVTPVTGAEQPVGLILDKSKSLALGVEQIPQPIDLLAWDIAGGVSGRTVNTVTTTSGGGVLIYVNPLLGKTAKITISGNTTSAFFIRNSGSIDGQVLVPVGDFNIDIINPVIFSNATRLYLNISSAGTLTINSLSVKEVQSNSAYQVTAIDRPILKRGITNLQLQSNTYSNAVWVLNNLTQATATGEFINGIQATRMTVSGSGVLYAAGTPLNSIAGTTYTIATYVRQGTARYVQLTVPSNIAGTNQWANFDLQNGTVAFSTGGTASIMAVSGGYIIAWSAVAIANITGQSFTAVVVVDWGGAGRAPNISTMIGQTVLIATTGVFIGAYTAQEIENKFGGIPITTSTTANTRLGEYYLFANGSNTSMRTNSINFSTTDEINIFAGMRKMQDASRAMVVELGNASANAFRFEAPLATNVGSIAYASGGSTGAFKEVSGFNSPISVIATGISKISTDLCRVNINSNPFATVTTDQGTGNYGTYPIYLFRRAGTSLPFNGNLYGLIVRGKLSTDKQIKDTEKYLAKKSALTLG